jgi:hypothetical protein
MADDIETWKAYGEWYPTARLRWTENGQLQQTWRRDYERRWGGGVVMGGNGFEEEWRDVPTTNGER